jgi:hypothetical protein
MLRGGPRDTPEGTSALRKLEAMANATGDQASARDPSLDEIADLTERANRAFDAADSADAKGSVAARYLGAITHVLRRPPKAHPSEDEQSREDVEAEIWDEVRKDAAAKYDAKYLRQIEGMFEAVGPDLIESLESLRNMECKSVDRDTDDAEERRRIAGLLLDIIPDLTEDGYSHTVLKTIKDAARALECRSVTARRYVEHWHIDGLRDLRLIVSNEDAAAIKAACDRAGYFTFNLQTTDCGSVDGKEGDDE